MKVENKGFNIVSCLRYITILFLILKTQTVFTFFSNIDLHINLVFVFLLAIFTSLRLLKKEISTKSNKKILLILGIYFIFVILYGMFTKCHYRPYYVNYLLVIPTLFFNVSASHNYKDEIYKILCTFINIVYFIAVVSLVFYSLGSVSKIIEPTNFVTINWGVRKVIPTYYFLHYDTQYINIMGDIIRRNSSIFTEAPMYSLVLSFALFYHVFFSYKKKANTIIILILTLLTTMTFSAFLSLSIIYIMYMLEKFTSKINKKTLIIWVLLLLVILTLTICVFVSRLKTSSIAIRLDDLKATFKAFYNNIIFGVGMESEEPIKVYMSSFRKYNTGLSNTIGLILAQGGLYYTTFYIIPFICLLNKKISYKVIFYIIFVFISLFAFVYLSTPLMFLNISILYSYLYNFIIRKKVII